MKTSRQNPKGNTQSGKTQKLRSALTMCALLALIVLSSNVAKAALVDLGTAGQYAVLEIGTGDLNISVNAGGLPNGIIGNVGLNGSGDLKLTGTTYVQGNVTVAQNVSQVVLSGSAYVTGSTIVNQAALTQARTDALAAAAQATFLGTQPGAINTYAASGITSGLHLTTPGVYNLSDLNLSGSEKLILGGGSYVFNISGDFKINGNSSKAGVFLDAGMSPSDVIFNYTGTSDIAFAGGGAGENSILYGVILSPNAKVALAPGTVFGEIIGGKNIDIVSGSDVVSVVPEPGTFVAGALLLMPFGVSAWRIIRRRS